MATTNVSIRMDSDLKAQADALFAELGMNLSTAFNIFVRQSLREGGIPFEIRTERPNKETVAAMLEAEHMCMTMRGVRKPGTKTLTYVCRGVFENNDELINRVLMMVR